MEGQNESIYASSPFKFIVDGNPLYIHANLVSSHSKPLHRLMNGHMAEAQKGFAVLEDVDAETFTRFIQWAYNGYYSPANFDIVADLVSSEQPNEVEAAPENPLLEIFKRSPILEPEAVVEDSFSGSWQPFRRDVKTKSSKKVKKVKSFYYEQATEHCSKDALKEMFIKRQTKVRRDSIVIPPPRPNQDPHEDYSNVFLSHARLHVFADKYDIKSLKKLALENLQTTLAIFTLYSERTGDVIELLRYIYGNTGESARGVEDLRTLMTHYVGIEMDLLIKDESFKDLMIDDGGALLDDFMCMVGKRI